MLSLPDFKEKQILVVSIDRDKENDLKFANDNIVFFQDGEVKNRLSCYKVLSVFIIGDFTITSVLIRKAMEFGISIFLLKYNLEQYASIGAQAEGNYLLRQNQYSVSNDKALEISRFLVSNKIANQFILLKKHKSTNLDKKEKEVFHKLSKADSIDSLRGVEGSLARMFFREYFDELGWYRRQPRTKVDIYNILLDIGYSLLFNYIDCLLRLFGFDVYKGFYHQLFFQRKSLTCDLVEPFRCIIDKSLLKAYHLNQINKKDFKFQKGRFTLSYKKSDKYIKIFLQEIMRQREDIYSYVKGFYDFFQHGGQFPNFKIK